MEVVRRYTFPPSSYPRYKYSALHVTRLINDCKTLIQKCGIQRNPHAPKFGYVVVDVISRKAETIIADDRLECKKCHKITSKTFTRPEYEALETTDDAATNVCVISKEEFENNGVPECFCGGLVVILVDAGTVFDDYHRLDGSDYMFVATTADNFAKQLANLLERYVFSYLKEFATALQCIAEAAAFDTHKISVKARAIAKPLLGAKSDQDERKSVSVWIVARTMALQQAIKTIYKDMPKGYRKSLLASAELNVNRDKLKASLCEDLAPIIGLGKLVLN